jgi:hypothetical protein
LNGIPTDPRALHKYLYANGDPINGIDPMGREVMFENALIQGGSKETVIDVAVDSLGKAIDKCFEAVATTLLTVVLYEITLERGVAYSLPIPITVCLMGIMSGK